MASDLPASARPAPVIFYNDPRVRSIAYQVALCAVVVFLVYGAASNAIENLAAGADRFGIRILGSDRRLRHQPNSDRYSSRGSTYGRAFWVGLLNTLLVAGIGIVLATILGFVIGISRLSSNWLLAKAAGCYVETVRNLPLLLQLLFWYNAVLKTLPDIRDSISIGGSVFLNNRGLFVPTPLFKEGFGGAEIALVAAIVGSIAYRNWARKRQERTGRQAPVLWVTLALVIGLPLVTFILSGSPLSFEFPQAGRFNITGGAEVLPEFVALLFGLSIYTAAFIAEVVRAGILAVSRGQTEAAFSLGLRPGPTLRLIVVPQAMRVIIPPLTSQYLNLTKNSSLAVAIGYPDLVQIFTGTVLNQTGQAVEVVAITMLVYLVISLTTSLLMNIYNSRMALKER